MNTHKNSTLLVCPHCGTENSRTEVMWLNNMNDGEPVLCVNCKKALYENKNAGHSSIEKRKSRHFLLRALFVAALLFGMIIFLNQAFGVFTFKEDSGRIFYVILIVLVISATLASGEMGQKLKHLAIWAGIFLILVTAYSYRHELSGVKERVLAELVPSKGYQKVPDSISFPVSSDGHFYIRAKVNGIPLTFLADTGASHIVLTPSDADKLGIETDDLSFDRFYETANGTVRGSSLRIADFRIGDIHLKGIGASVNEVGMRNSLLGMTFFNRFKSYEVKNDILTLYWNE